MTSKSVILLDRHSAPGGHWVDSYEFVKLHQPSTFCKRALSSGFPSLRLLLADGVASEILEDEGDIRELAYLAGSTSSSALYLRPRQSLVQRGPTPEIPATSLHRRRRRDQ